MAYSTVQPPAVAAQLHPGPHCRPHATLNLFQSCIDLTVARTVG